MDWLQNFIKIAFYYVTWAYNHSFSFYSIAIRYIVAFIISLYSFFFRVCYFRILTLLLSRSFVLSFSRSRPRVLLLSHQRNKKKIGFFPPHSLIFWKLHQMIIIKSMILTVDIYKKCLQISSEENQLNIRRFKKKHTPKLRQKYVRI